MKVIPPEERTNPLVCYERPFVEIQPVGAYNPIRWDLVGVHITGAKQYIGYVDNENVAIMMKENIETFLRKAEKHKTF